jgi:lysine 2,3-aminomutase
MEERGVRRLGRQTRANQLWSEEPAILQILEQSETHDEARQHLLAYLGDLEADLRIGAFDIDRMEWASALDCIAAFKNMLSPENEAMAGFSTLDLLRHLGNGDSEDEISEGFVAEFTHLFRAINGQSGVGHGWLGSRIDVGKDELDSLPGSGRRAAVARSRFLDQLADELWREVKRYPSGLDPSQIRTRHENRRQILEFLGGTSADWATAEWQSTHVLKGEDGAKALRELVPLSSEELAAIRLAVRYRIPWGITPYYLSLFDFDSSDRRSDGQVRSQVIPPIHTVRAMIEHRQDRDRTLDYMRERDTSPIERITRRYPTIAIFKVCDTCPQVCTYCQRNWEISDAMMFERIPSREALEPAVDWFEQHDGITDVLLTGGDPLVLSDTLLSHLLARFGRMNHIRNIRIGTRVPVTMPMRVTDELAKRLGSAVLPGRRNVALVTHVESAHEVTPDLAAAVDRLRRNGVSVYNQQVYTLETSRRFQAVATRVALRQVGVDPYYTFYTKGKDEHRDYLVPIARILQERKEEARLLPGIFRTDEPVFNVPGLGKSHLRARQDRELIGVRADGRRVYLFHPWEKGIAPVAPWPYVDVSISEYLKRIEALGEDPAEYESIWYYY